jgi:hypothetical protein
VPADGAREQLGLVEELLDVVFAKVRVQGVRGLVEGEDIVCGLELGDGDEADLVGGVSGCVVGLGLGWVCTFLPAVFAALMREVMEAMLSARCLARWGLTCMSSAMAGVE